MKSVLAEREREREREKERKKALGEITFSDPFEKRAAYIFFRDPPNTYELGRRPIRGCVIYYEKLAQKSSTCFFSFFFFLSTHFFYLFSFFVACGDATLLVE